LPEIIEGELAGYGLWTARLTDVLRSTFSEGVFSTDLANCILVAPLIVIGVVALDRLIFWLS
jgi:hypothetical protein